MDLTEKTLGSQVIYDGVIVKLRKDAALLSNGVRAGREVVEHPGGVGVVALDKDGSVLVVRQFRYPLGEVLLEIPAGKLDHPGEDHLAAGKRELSEETGAQAGKWTYLGFLHSSPGFSTEVIHLYLAEELTFGSSHLDEGEFLAADRIPLSELIAMALDGRLTDAKSVVGVLKTAILRKEG